MTRFLVILFIAISLNGYSQKRKVYFLKNNGEFTKKDQADFKRVVEGPVSGADLYQISEFYPDGIRKLTGTASAISPEVIWQGSIMTFDKQGRKVQHINYQNGVRTGPSDYYFTNGKLSMQIEYNNREGMEVAGNKALRYKLRNFFDSTGVQLVLQGNGYVKEAIEQGYEEGKYVNGVRQGIWKGFVAKDSSVYEDYYKNGLFVSGKNLRPGGDVIMYTRKQIFPRFPGGKTALKEFLRKNLRYPPESREHNVSGRVVVSFFVEKDGSLTNFRVISSPDSSLEGEALRVLASSPKWEPAMQNGIPLRVESFLPLTFSLKQSDQLFQPNRPVPPHRAATMRF